MPCSRALASDPLSDPGHEVGECLAGDHAGGFAQPGLVGQFEPDQALGVVHQPVVVVGLGQIQGALVPQARWRWAPRATIASPSSGPWIRAANWVSVTAVPSIRESSRSMARNPPVSSVEASCWWPLSRRSESLEVVVVQRIGNHLGDGHERCFVGNLEDRQTQFGGLADDGGGNAAVAQPGAVAQGQGTGAMHGLDEGLLVGDRGLPQARGEHDCPGGQEGRGIAQFGDGGPLDGGVSHAGDLGVGLESQRGGLEKFRQE